MPVTKAQLINPIGINTFTSANNPAISVRSGVSTSYTAIDIGRTSSEGIFAVASGAGVYAADAVGGDIVLRSNTGNNKLLFTNLGNNSSLAISGNNVLVGTVSSTGTASQPLQVNGGAYISGNLGVGFTNPTSKIDVIAQDGFRSTGFQPFWTIRDSNDSNKGFRLQTASGNTLFAVDNTGGGTYTERMRLDANGNIIINTTSATGTASQPLQVTGGAYVSTRLGVGVTNPSLNLQVNGTSSATDTRFQSVGEKSTIVSGNVVNINYNAGTGNVAICTNPTGDITLNVNGIPTDSSFDNTTLTFSVIVNNTGTARSCTAVNLNGIPETIRWAGGSLASAITGVTTTSGYDIYSFTGINTVGSASTAANYVVLGVVNGGYR